MPEEWKQAWREEWLSDAAKDKAFVGSFAISPLARFLYLYAAGVNYVARWWRHRRSW